MPEPLQPTTEHWATVARLETMARALGQDTPATKGLRMLVALMEHRPVVDISNLVKRTPNRVNQVWQQAVASGLSQELERIETKLAKALSKQRGHSRVGRPGHKTWENYEQSSTIDGEPYIELTTLLVTACFQLAIFGTGRTLPLKPKKKKAGKSDDDESHGLPLELAKDLRTIVEAVATEAPEDPPPWTHVSQFDEICAELFSTLEDELEKMAQHTVGRIALEELPLCKVLEQFPNAGPCYAVWAGDSDIAASILGRLFEQESEFDQFPLRMDDNFVSVIATIVFQCRNTLTGLGTLPALWELYSVVNESTGQFPEEISWQGNADETSRWLRRRFAVRDFFALGGVLFGHNRFLAERVPHREEFTFRTLSVATQVDVVDSTPDPPSTTVTISPLPELSYEITLDGIVFSKQAAAQIRKNLQALHETRQFVYSAKTADLENPLAILTKMLAGVPASKVSRAHATFSPKRLVLLPRHILLPDASTLAPGADVAADRVRRIGGSSEAFILISCPSLKGAVERAFDQNKIGDAVQRLSTWQERLSTNVIKRSGGDLIGWSAATLGFANYTPCFFALPKDAAPTGDEKMDSRIQQFRYSHWERENIHILEERACALWLEIKRLREEFGGDPRGLRAAITALMGEPKWREPTMPGDFAPAYDRDESFLDALRELDADFIFANLGVENTALFERLTEQWRDRSLDVIIDRLTEKGRPHISRLKAGLLPQISEMLTAEDVEELFYKALDQFGDGRCKVLRWAIETAQRRVLAGMPPEFYVCESENSLFRSWRSYFGRFCLRQLDVRKTEFTREDSDVADSAREEDIDRQGDWDPFAPPWQRDW